MNSYLGGLTEKHLDALAAWQLEADQQADRWIERELVNLALRRQPTGLDGARITYTRRRKLATIAHGGHVVREDLRGRTL